MSILITSFRRPIAARWVRLLAVRNGQITDDINVSSRADLSAVPAQPAARMLSRS